MASKLVPYSPGPAAYNMSSTIGSKKQAHLYSFSGKARPSRDFPTPGPDKYATQDIREKGVSYSMAGKYHTREKQANPAPGAYFEKGVPSSLKDGPSYSLSGRHRVINKEITPAPDRYNVLTAAAKTLPATPAFSLAAKTRVREHDSNPGPGEYHLEKFGAVGKGGPKYSLSARLRSRHDDPAPGPGTYTSKDLIATEAPKYSLSARTYRTKPNETPGPGAYMQDLKKVTSFKDGPAISMSKRLRPPRGDDAGPGPGSYKNDDAALKLHQGPSYTTAGRNHQKRPDITPGPGQHDVEKAKSKLETGPKFSMAGRTRQKSGDPTPGPKYDLNVKNEGPQFSMSGKYRTRIKESEITPSPAAYNLPKQKGKGITLAGKFGRIREQPMPGPGQYHQNLDTKIAGPKISMAQKLPYFSSTFATTSNVSDLMMKTPTRLAPQAAPRLVLTNPQ